MDPKIWGIASQVSNRTQKQGKLEVVVTLRLFAQAKETAGQSTLTVDASTVSEALSAATAEFGDSFVAVLQTSNIWLNGSPIEGEPELSDSDELAILPPVSGG